MNNYRCFYYLNIFLSNGSIIEVLKNSPIIEVLKNSKKHLPIGEGVKGTAAPSIVL